MSKFQITAAVFLFACAAYVQAEPSAEYRQGTWTVRPSVEPGNVEFAMTHSAKGRKYQYFASSLPFFRRADRVPSSKLGIDLLGTEGGTVHFRVQRDAGLFDFTGVVIAGSGSGSFIYTSDPQYVRDMNSAGLTGIDADTQFALAVHDVGLDLAQSLARRQLPGLDISTLISFKFFGGTSEFVSQLEKMGYANVSMNRLIEFRIFSISPAYIHTLRTLGYETLTPETLVMIRSMGITLEDIEEIQARQGRLPTIGQLTAEVMSKASRSNSDAETQVPASNSNINH